VLAIKAFGPVGDAGVFEASSESAALAKALTFAADQGAKVINMSLGLPVANPNVNPDKLLADAIGFADSKGALVVAAAGNWAANAPDADKKLFYPAADPRVFAVGAVDQNNIIANFSARNSDRILMAPGVKVSSVGAVENGIWSTILGGGFGGLDNNRLLAGTSQASPMVAAVAGLILTNKPNLSVQQVKDLLQSTAKDLGAVGRDTTYGYGLLQAGAALRKAANPDQPPPPKTTVYVYADRKKPDGTFDANSPQAGRTVVILEGLSGSVNYAITAGRDGKALTAGTYRIVACINKNSNGIACDVGDLGGERSNSVDYNGSPVNNIDVTVVERK
jgi:subtilisin family serine protease